MADPADASSASRRAAWTLAVAVGVVATWALAAMTVFDDKAAVPTPSAVMRSLWRARDGLWTSVGYTLSAALKGMVGGIAAAAVVAVVAVLLPATERTLLRVAVAASALPIVAVAPVLVVSLSGDAPVAALAGLATVFPAVVALVNGLNAIAPGLVHVTHGFGGRRRQLLVHVRAPTALPALFAALRIAFPAAMIGAIIGEFIQGRRGLGVNLVQKLGEGDTAGTWAVGVVITIVTTIGVAVISLAQRFAVRWDDVALPAAEAAAHGSRWRPLLQVTDTVLALAVLGMLWVGFLRWFDVDPFVGKGPRDVVEFFTDDRFAVDRGLLLAALGQTLFDTGLGLFVGWGSGIAIAVAFVRFAPLERVLLPVAVALRTIPIIALLPALTLIVGRGTGAVVTIVSLIVFFPTLVLVRRELGAVSADHLAFARSQAARPSTLIWRLRVPNAVPAMLASLRIACPAALLGALLAEFLVTGRGLGYRLISASTRSAYAELWAGTVLVTVVAIVGYAIVDSVERATTRRFLT
jgi:ABC-type nitrate/sulfonate/bicarbonate transport system permease component